ncbi:hypothetical protein AB0N07_06610 [Streptomyces sp. NPDC051172]|uniref:hypothetical protein n=1 Tax=Streptomyces sp. NPDC051172 TaxID=3155796 RepID=UPI0034311961
MLTPPAHPGDIPVPTDGIIQLKGPDGTTKTYRRTSWTSNDGLGFTVAEGSCQPVRPSPWPPCGPPWSNTSAGRRSLTRSWLVGRRGSG